MTSLSSHYAALPTQLPRHEVLMYESPRPSQSHTLFCTETRFPIHMLHYPAMFSQKAVKNEE